MTPKVNRREALGALGIASTAVAAVSAPAAQARPIEQGRFVRHPGVQGRMTGAQAAAVLDDLERSEEPTDEPARLSRLRAEHARC